MTRSFLPAPVRASQTKGFTLLEAIVAVAIVGLSLVAIMTLISQTALQLTAASESVVRNLAKQTAVAFMEPINPVESPEGESDLGDIQLKWASTAIIPHATEIRPGSGLAGFGIGFYKVTVTVGRAEEPDWFSFDLRKVGYKSLMSGMMGMP